MGVRDAACARRGIRCVELGMAHRRRRWIDPDRSSDVRNVSRMCSRCKAARVHRERRSRRLLTVFSHTASPFYVVLMRAARNRVACVAVRVQSNPPSRHALQVISFCARQSFSVDRFHALRHDACTERHAQARTRGARSGKGDIIDLGFSSALRRELDLALRRSTRGDGECA